MNIKILYPRDNKADGYQHGLAYTAFNVLILYGITHFVNQVYMCDHSILSLSPIEILQNGSVWQCPISYDKCLCAVTSNTFNNTRGCINIVYDVVGRTLPPLAFILEIYIVYQLYSLRGTCSYVLRILLWITAFLVLVFITIAYGNICLHLHAIYGVCSFVIVQLLIMVCLMMRNHYADPPRQSCKTYYRQRSYKKKLIIVQLYP